MSDEQNIAATPLQPSVRRRLVNKKDKTYFIAVASENPGRFVRELWESMPDRFHGCPADDKDACGEWTDRMRNFRTTVSGDEAIIRTHAWHPQSDTEELHKDVLKFLRGYGIAV